MNAEQKQAARNLIDDFKDAGNEWDEAAVASHMTALLQELVEAPEVEPALVVEVEPDYWHRGHYCEGSKPYINPLEVWKLPVGTKLYTAPPEPSVPDAHPDDIAVDRFAAAMKTKMAKSRAVGRYGWDDPATCSADDLRLFLVNHIAKGDPVDVGNFAMMLFNRHETTAQPHPEPPADPVRDAERYRWLLRQAWFQQAADRFDLPDGGLQKRFEKCMDAFADAAIERDKLKGQS